jgi:hypothetical protein
MVLPNTKKKKRKILLGAGPKRKNFWFGLSECQCSTHQKVDGEGGPRSLTRRDLNLAQTQHSFPLLLVT